MDIDNFFKFLGKGLLYVSGTGGIAYGLFLFFGKKWIENKFATRLEEYKAAQNKELEDFKFKVNTLFNRAVNIHEKEYDVLPTAWAQLQDALGLISSLVSPLQTYPDFSRLRDIEIRAILKDYKWQDYQIDDMLAAYDKNVFFQAKIFWQRLGEAKSKFSKFHNYIVKNRIFLSTELKEQFNKADDLLWDALTTREVGEEAKDYKMIRESYKKLKENIENVLTAIESLIQERLHCSGTF